MKEQSNHRHVDDVLDLLDASEIDQFVVSHLKRIEAFRDVLVAVALGDVKASPYQRKTALFLLGVLRVREAAPQLIGLLESERPALGLHAMAALRKIGPDKAIGEALVTIARDGKSTAPEVAYALRALRETSDPLVIETARQHPPAHLDDSGVWSAWQALGPDHRGRS